jgi:hypothetical protein
MNENDRRCLADKCAAFSVAIACVMAVFAAGELCRAADTQPSSTLTFGVGGSSKQVSPTFYGLMTEEINHSLAVLRSSVYFCH